MRASPKRVNCEIAKTLEIPGRRVDIDKIDRVDTERLRGKRGQIANAPVLAMQNDFSTLAQNPLGDFTLRGIVDFGAAVDEW